MCKGGHYSELNKCFNIKNPHGLFAEWGEEKASDMKELRGTNHGKKKEEWDELKKLEKLTFYSSIYI